MSKRAGSQPLHKALAKCQILGSESVLGLLFYLDLIVNSDFAVPGEYSGSQAAALAASCFLLLAP